MTRVTWCLALAWMTGCTGGPVTINVCPDGCNFDMEIDGGGLDWNAAIKDPAQAEQWKADTSDSFDVQMCAAGENIYAVWTLVNYVLDDEGAPQLTPAGEKIVDGVIDTYFTRSADRGNTWLPEPIRINQGAGDTSSPHMDCLGDRIYVAWEDNRDGETGYQNIYLNFSTDGGNTWLNEDVALDNDPDGAAISLGPRVALFEGQVHVVWYDQSEGAPDIYIASSINGGRKFLEPLRISGGQEDEDQVGASWNGNPQIAIDATGRIYVSWESTKNGKQDLFLASSITGGQTFSVQRRIDTGDERGANYSFAPKLGVSVTDNGTPDDDSDDSPHAYVVWHDTRSGEFRDIYMNYSGDGGNTWFDEAARVETDATGFAESQDPSLLVEGDTAHVVWRDARFGGYDIYYRKAVGGAFDATEEVRLDTDDPGFGNSVNPQIAKGGLDGNTLVSSWVDYRSDNSGSGYYNDIFYNHNPVEDSENAGWGPEDQMLKSQPIGTSFTENLQLALKEDTIYSMWIDGRNGSRDVFFSHVPVGEGIESLSILNTAGR